MSSFEEWGEAEPKTTNKLDIGGFPGVDVGGDVERVTGFEPVNGSLGSYCLTTWRHPLGEGHFIINSIQEKSELVEKSVFVDFPSDFFSSFPRPIFVNNMHYN